MKLRNNKPLTPDEIKELERILFDGSERGTKEDFVKEMGEQPLGKFIRSIVGMDVKAAQEAFGAFLTSGEMSSDQIAFIQNIIDYLTKNGTIDKTMLFDDPPFTNLHDDGALGVFNDGQVRKVIDIVDAINSNAEVG
jgi:type I restriction enzyme R subunit